MERHKRYGGKVTLLYDDGPHTYDVEDDDGDFPSTTRITGILDKPALRHWYVNRSIAFIKESIYPGVAYDEIQLDDVFKDAKWGGTRARDGAANIGKKVHEWIERHVQHQITTGKVESFPIPVHTGIADSISKFLAWEEEAKPTYLLSEYRTVSMEHHFSGTLDLLYRNGDGHYVLGDIKTGKSVYPEHYLQTAGYAAMLLEEMPAEMVDFLGAIELKREIIHIPLQGKLSVKLPKNDLATDMEAFIALSKVYHWKEGK